MFSRAFVVCSLLLAVVKADLCKDHSCDCTTTKGETSVDCRSRGIKELPSFENETMSKVRSIDFSENEIQKIPVLFEIYDLKTLDLNDNEIFEIAPKAFENFTYLVTLDLSHNQLYDVNSLSDGLSGLRYLNLSHNLIRSLPNNVFQEMDELIELRLTGNPLHYVRNDHFRTLHKVIFLDLSGCGLTSLPDDVFHEMTELHELQLSYNNFEKVPSAGLRSASNLKTLSLNGNSFHTIKANSFKNCKLLQTLELSDMGSLESISPGAFSGLKQLKVLKISNNPYLKNVDFGAFEGLYNSLEESWILEKLDLRDNRLCHIHSPSASICQIKTLDLQGNPWNCDCNLLWITECNLGEELTSNLKCASPNTVKDKLIRQVPPEEMPCLPDEHLERQHRALRIVVVTSAVVGLLFCGVIIIIVIKKRKIMEWWYYRKRGSGAVYYVKAKTNSLEERGDM